MPATDACISGIFTPGSIGASAGATPTRPRPARCTLTTIRRWSRTHSTYANLQLVLCSGDGLMPGSVTTKTIRDGSANLLNFRIWDESGAGAGPYSFFTILGADGVKLAKAEDTAHADGDEGVPVFAVRKDTPVALGADGSYAPLIVDPLGRLHIAPFHCGYETVAASATDQALGATGATGDYLQGLLVVPATTSPGTVSIKDGAGSAITIFTGGASSVSNLVPFFVPLGIKSTGGAWSVTTGTNVSVIASGNFA